MKTKIIYNFSFLVLKTAIYPTAFINKGNIFICIQIYHSPKLFALFCFCLLYTSGCEDEKNKREKTEKAF